ncbi:MAG: HAMP domain-containing protein, partial [Lachnospiraceae bacterium]|nr:HAMP domain-containing protein [Lachnospiraceae bacterium]
MRSTLYLKFIIVYIIFGFLSLFTVATLTSSLMETPMQNYMTSTMYTEANLIANNYLSSYFSNELDGSEVALQLSGIETQLDAAVWFVDKEGNVLFSAQPYNYPMSPSVIEDFNPAESGSSQSQTGDYHGYFDEDVITVIAPVVYNYSPKGYLLIHKYVSDLSEFQHILLRATTITMIVIYLLSFMILLAFQFFVYRPLRKVTEAAKQYASGNLEYEIPVNTEDEMGYLSASLNYMSSQLKDMEDYQKKFVANVSHDFRSPLTSIKGYVEAMVDGTIPSELHEKYLKIILF